MFGENSELPEPQSGKFEGSFAYKTIKDRMPQILTKTIDSLHRRNGEVKTAFGADGLNQLNSAIAVLSQLRYEIMTNKPLRELTADANSESSDIDIWNAWLAKYKSSGLTWFSGPWLEVECYMYRVVHEGFRNHKLIEHIDPFGEAKLDNLTASAGALENLIGWYEQAMLVNGAHSSKCEDFDVLLQLSLWGNRCDLSLSSGNQAAASASHMTPVEEIEHLKPWLLVDHSSSIWKWLNISSTASPKRIDIVLDNSGYELINDLLLTDWLLHQRDANGMTLFSPVVLHCKAFPWFVSDTTIADFELTLNWLKDREMCGNLAERLLKMIANSQLCIEAHPYWTTPHHYWHLKELAPDLHGKLTSSSLVIFKGDLNGRKMFADLKWEPTAPLERAMAPLINLFENGTTALCLARTLKCEVGFGLAEEVASRLEKESPDWAFSGQYGEIQAIVPKI